ncbi:MAG: hypothetical protein D8M58_10390 [Calditrichaeota bacterium]|nr:MAG: hypothetical protein DWQ03_09765 [Calditrichota bacterium]MBL1205798.1 hypothetical protein [Calditrichota bacterium]NOG45626.1 hypothetical protein [Calditrichota bacterium]
MDELKIIQQKLIAIFKEHIPPLKIEIESETNFKVSGTKEAMQGKQKVDGYYFGSVVPKPKDIRLYYFPIYTHVSDFENISSNLRKCLKGKSCFHIKKMDVELENDIRKMVNKGVELYLKDELI